MIFFPDGHTLVESLAIMHYLEETRPQRPLLPQDVLKRAKVREICEVRVSISSLKNAYLIRFILGHRLRHPAAAEPNRADPRRRGEEEGVGSALDHPWLPGHREAAVDVGRQVLRRR